MLQKCKIWEYYFFLLLLSYLKKETKIVFFINKFTSSRFLQRFNHSGEFSIIKAHTKWTYCSGNVLKEHELQVRKLDVILKINIELLYKSVLKKKKTIFTSLICLKSLKWIGFHCCSFLHYVIIVIIILYKVCIISRGTGAD